MAQTSTSAKPTVVSAPPTTAPLLDLFGEPIRATSATASSVQKNAVTSDLLDIDDIMTFTPQTPQFSPTQELKKTLLKGGLSQSNPARKIQNAQESDVSDMVL